MVDNGKGFVYGLHAFSAENQDEISFGPGEQVVVLEKDDQYGDGWWQGRNAAGDEGLFPVSYTSPNPLPPPEEEAATSSTTPPAAAPEIHLSSPPRTAPLQLPPSGSSASVLTNGGSSTHMNETITDIQEAIEHLGGGLSSASISGLNENGSIRSFQSRGEEDSHYDDSIGGDGVSAMQEGEGGDETEHDEVGWSASTRKRLAEKAMSENRKREQRETEKEIKRREREESEKQSWGANGGGASGLPAGVEFSDESEDDDDHNLSPQQPGASSPILHHHDEDPTLTTNNGIHAIPIPVGLDRTLASGGIGRSPPASPPPAPAAVDSSTIGLATTSDRLKNPSSELAYTSNENLTAGQKATRALESAVSDPSAVSKEPSPFRSVIPDQVDSSAAVPLPSPTESDARRRSLTSPAAIPQQQQQPPVLGSPLTTTNVATPPFVTPTEQVVANPFNHNNGNGHVANGSSPASTINEGGVGMRPPSPTKSALRRPTSSSFGAGTGAAGVQGEPLEWGIDEVVGWAKRRGFGPDIWEKFLEHEITGDVLLELDINLLKEIDIVAFGKRHKLATAIADLRNQTHPSFNPSSGPGGAGSSIRSVSTSLHPQSPTFFTPSTGRDSMGNGLPSPGYAFAQQQAQQQQQQYVQRGGSMVGPAGETFATMSPEGSGRGEFGEVGSPSSTNGGYGNVVGLGLGGGNDGSRTRESSYGNPIPSSPNGPTLSRSSSHIRKPSGVDSLVGTQITEEPEAAKEPSPLQSSSITSSAPTSSKGFASKPEAASSKTDVGSIGSKSSSVPASPASAGPITGAKRGSVGHKKSKPSMDEGGKSSSFVGNFLQGSRSGRKPAPRLSSNPTLTEKITSPDLALDKSSSSMRASKSSTNNNNNSSPTFRRASKMEGNGGPAMLRKRMSVAEPSPTMPSSSTMEGGGPEPARALDRLPTPDFAGYLRKKGERYNSWKLRYCVLSGPHLYYLKSENDAKFKGYINMAGYKVIADENANPGYYGFRIIHDKEAPHFFSLQEQGLVRDWMKALMKATISRDYSTPVVSSCNIPTMTLKEAQSMSPAPRPPSPSERAAMQAASRRENPNQLTARDASVLMGLPSNSSGNARASIPSSFAMPVSVPPRPSREMRRPSGPVALSSSTSSSTPKSPTKKTSPALAPTSPVVATSAGNVKNLAWVNSKLPKDFPPVVNNPESFRSGLALVRLVETISGLPSGIPVNEFVVKTKQEHEDLLYRAFDYFIDAGVDMDGLHVEDVVVGNPEGIDRIIERMKERASKPKTE